MPTGHFYLVKHTSADVMVSTSAPSFLLTSVNIYWASTLCSWHCHNDTVSQALSWSGHTSNDRVCKGLCGMIGSSLLYILFHSHEYRHLYFGGVELRGKDTVIKAKNKVKQERKLWHNL